MSPVHIKTRMTRPDAKGKAHPRYLVYYRRGGRGFKDEYAGSFKTKREAQLRRDLIAGEIAAGRDPRVMLAALAAPPVQAPGLETAWDAWALSRVDVREKAHKQYVNARTWWLRLLGATRDPETITAADVQAGITEMAKALKPSSIAQYVSSLAMALDYADIEPNPVRSRKVRLPKADAEDINPPTTAEWFAIRTHVKKRSLLPLRLIECCGFRISEAVNLDDGDIDYVDGKIRVSRSRTKTASGQRWLAVPGDLMDELAARRAPEDRAIGRAVFPEITGAQVRHDLGRACTDAGVTAHHPHNLRHRRISLWLRHGIDPVTVAVWAGHARSSMSLDVYGHVVLDPREDEWRAFWLSVYAAERSPREAPVRHRDGVGE